MKPIHFQLGIGKGLARDIYSFIGHSDKMEKEIIDELKKKRRGSIYMKNLQFLKMALVIAMTGFLAAEISAQEYQDRSRQTLLGTHTVLESLDDKSKTECERTCRREYTKCLELCSDPVCSEICRQEYRVCLESCEI